MEGHVYIGESKAESETRKKEGFSEKIEVFKTPVLAYYKSGFMKSIDSAKCGEKYDKEKLGVSLYVVDAVKAEETGTKFEDKENKIYANKIVKEAIVESIDLSRISEKNRCDYLCNLQEKYE